MSQQPSNPASIRLVGLPLGPAAHLMRIPDEHLYRSGKDVIDGPPIYCCNLHGYHRTMQGTKPIEQRQQR
jgi:hypothetical protein